MKRIVYRSTSTLAPGDLGLLDMIRSCDRNNARAGVTGCLYFSARFFLQAIEGRNGAVDHLFSQIRRDARHHSIFMLETIEIEHRHWADFSIQFHPRLPVAGCPPLSDQGSDWWGMSGGGEAGGIGEISRGVPLGLRRFVTEALVQASPA